MCAKPGRARSANSRFMGVWGLALTMLAILLWGKLKLVTGVPRTAYADPKAAAAAPSGAPKQSLRQAAPVPANRPDLAGD
jgi:hypothetical protein